VILFLSNKSLKEIIDRALKLQFSVAVPIPGPEITAVISLRSMKTSQQLFVANSGFMMLFR
jgi:hypothetical protein